MNYVSQTVKDLVETAYQAKLEDKTVCRFSVDVSWENNRRLSYVTKKLGMSKSSVVSSLVNSALREFEEEFGIKTPEQIADYWSWVNSNEPVPDFSDDIKDLKVTYTDHRGTRVLNMEATKDE